MSVESIITENLDVWTSAVKTKSASGRGSSNKLELYGIKKLRELILELAIRGKLVAQNPNDEPARELLKKTVAQKEVLLSQGKIKKSRKLGETNNGEVPFELPIGWEWVLIDQLGHDLGQEKPNSTFSYIDVGCIDKANGVIKEPGVLNAEDAPSRARKLVKRGCILYSTVRPYLLNIAVVEEDIFPKPIASTAFAVIQPFDGINSSYIYRYLRSPTIVKPEYLASTERAYQVPIYKLTKLKFVQPYNHQRRGNSPMIKRFNKCCFPKSCASQTINQIPLFNFTAPQGIEFLLGNKVHFTLGKKAIFCNMTCIYPWNTL